MHTTQAENGSTDIELFCPIPGCNYSHLTPKGRAGHVQFSEAFPELDTATRCAVCARSDTLARVTIDDGGAVTMCRTCRKEYWGVSS